MAEKKAILAVTANLALTGGGAAMQKFLKKAVVVSNFAGGPVAEAAKALEGAVATDLAGLEGFMAGEASLAVVELGSLDAAALDEAVGKINDAANRSTLTVLVGDNAAAFHGLGIDAKKGSIDRAAAAQDILPTMSYIADLPVPENCTGAVLYQVLKDINLKLKEAQKLKEALQRMEAALQRDNREPWDKHDCA